MEGDVVNSMFGIDPISGVISLVSKVPETYYPNDQDDEEIYSVKVVVTDSGLSPSPLSNSRTYDIQIIRKNIHTPIYYKVELNIAWFFNKNIVHYELGHYLTYL